MNTRTANKLKDTECLHHSSLEEPGVALIVLSSSISNSGLGQALYDILPKRIQNNICWFNTKTHRRILVDCLSGHRAAVIIDLTNCGAEFGTVSIIDLNTAMTRNSPFNAVLSDGHLLMDELYAAQNLCKLPKRLIFFGIETNQLDKERKISALLQEKQYGLVQKLSALVTKLIQTLVEKQ